MFVQNQTPLANAAEPFAAKSESPQAREKQELPVIEKQRQAHVAAAKKDYEAVVSLLQPLLSDLDLNHSLLLAQAQSELGNHGSAIKTLEVIRSKRPKNPIVLTELGRQQINTEQHRQGLLTLKSVTEMYPKHRRAYEVIAEYYEARNNRYELRVLYGDMVARIGEDPDFIAQLCRLHSLDGLFENAEKFCRRGITLNPKEPLNYLYLANTLQLTQRPKTAERFYVQATQKFPKSAQAFLLFGEFLSEQKRPLEAVRAFSAASSIDPKAGRAWTGLALASFEIQNYDESLRAFREACRFIAETKARLRQLSNELRKINENEWASKFEQTADSCSVIPAS